MKKLAIQVFLLMLLSLITSFKTSDENTMLSLQGQYNPDALTCYSDGAACIMDAQCCCKHCRWAINAQTCVPLNSAVNEPSLLTR